MFNTNSEICDPWISAKALALWPSGECGEKRSVTSYTLTMFAFYWIPCVTQGKILTPSVNTSIQMPYPGIYEQNSMKVQQKL